MKRNIKKNNVFGKYYLSVSVDCRVIYNEEHLFFEITINKAT